MSTTPRTCPSVCPRLGLAIVCSCACTDARIVCIVVVGAEVVVTGDVGAGVVGGGVVGAGVVSEGVACAIVFGSCVNCTSASVVGAVRCIGDTDHRMYPDIGQSVYANLIKAIVNE